MSLMKFHNILLFEYSMSIIKTMTINSHVIIILVINFEYGIEYKCLYFTEKLNVLYAKNWTQLAHQHIRTYEEHLSELTSNFNGIEEILNPHQRWTFIRSFHYSLSLMTTIGKFRFLSIS